MRFRRVKASAFGPLVDAELEFGEGLTVVWGPNEAAKSSWHSAMYAALCGRRRRSGRSVADENFKTSHQPWDGDRWAVAAEIDLDDGRRVSISRDLAERQSDIIDAALGREIADEIMNDGSPDGALWLGLDRSTFLSTACIRQAEIAAVTESPDGLKHLLQQAASTLGGDVTASDALAALSKFRKDKVGQDRAKAIRPLRLAKEAITEAQTNLADVQLRQQGFLGLVADRAATLVDVDAARQNLIGVQAGVERGLYIQDVKRSDQLTSLLDAKPSLPASVPADTELEDLERLLAQWTTASGDAVASSSEDLGSIQATTESLRAQLAQVPDMPVGDSVVAPNVSDAVSALEVARATQLGQSERPVAVGHSLEDLREAHRQALIAETPVPIDNGAVEALEAAEKRAQVQQQQRRLGYLAGAAAVVLLAVAVGLVLAGQTLLAAGAVVFSLGGFGLFLRLRLQAGQPLAELQERVSDYQRRLASHREQVSATTDFVERSGLPCDSGQLQGLVHERSLVDATESNWLREHQLRDETVQRCESDLAGALRDRGITMGSASGLPDSTDVGVALDSYMSAVANSASANEQRRGAATLAERLRLSLEAEDRIIRQVQVRTSVIDALKALLNNHDPDQVAAGSEELAAWSTDTDVVIQAEALLETCRYARRVQVEHATVTSRIEAIIDGTTIEAVLSRGAVAAAALDRNEAGFVADASQQDAAAQILSKAEQSDAGMSGRLAMISASEVDVSGAEAVLAGAERELERVQRLAVVLDRTSEHLGRAEEQAFRIVAPRLAEQISAVLPSVTAGRYVDATVDPESLSVTVRDAGGRFRSAGALSHGTTEQIYLLLRIAMAKILTKPGESCPIIIDDSTVHADQRRTEALLSVLREVSAESQIVIFTQEQHVLEWARENLTGRDHLVELSPVA